MKRGVWLALIAVLLAGAVAQGATMTVKLQFVNHLQAKLPEQDVFIVRTAGSGQVYRVTAADKDRNAILYAAAQPVRHNPFSSKANGPYKQGRSLGITLSQWLDASGSGNYSCANGTGTVRASFKNLVPRALYTMWYFFLPTPPTQPFTGTLDLPLGARDGSQNSFHADSAGSAVFRATFKPCLQLSSEQLASGLAIAWHSDGKAYGSDAGPFGYRSHVQLFLLLPPATAR